MLASLLYDTVYGGGAKRPEWMKTSRSYPLLKASGKAISEFVAERRALPTGEAGSKNECTALQQGHFAADSVDPLPSSIDGCTSERGETLRNVRQQRDCRCVPG